MSVLTTLPAQTSPARTTEPLPELERRTPWGLARLATALAARGDLWRPLLHVDPDDRWYARLATGDGWEAWLLTWLPGQRTGLHDHGDSAGAFTVLAGRLVELTPTARTGPGTLAERTLTSPDVRAFGPEHVHEVVGSGDGPAASLHVYGPRLERMNRYEFDAVQGLRLVASEREGSDW